MVQIGQKFFFCHNLPILEDEARQLLPFETADEGISLPLREQSAVVEDQPSCRDRGCA